MPAIKIGLFAAIMVGSLSTAFARVAVPTEPYGTPAEQQQCINNMEASLHGQSPLGSRDGPGYIQDLGELQSEGLTEYDVLDNRCRSEFFHQWLRAHGGRVQ
jgi:hypothetical protein